MDDSEQRLQELFQKLIHEYVERFHEPYFHFGESYPQSRPNASKTSSTGSISTNRNHGAKFRMMP